MKIFWTILLNTVLISMVVFANPAEPQQSDPVKTIKEMVNIISTNMVADRDLKEAASKDKKLFEGYRNKNQGFYKQLSQFMDFEKLGSDSMTKKWKDQYWKRSSNKKKFLETLQALIEEIVYPRGKEFFDKVTVNYDQPKLSQDGKQADVICTIHVKENKQVQLQYRLVLQGSMWKIYDVNLEGEWWTESFKSQFNHIITTKSYDELILAMEKKLQNHLSWRAS